MKPFYLLARAVFALSVAAFGIETIVCANLRAGSVGYPYVVIPVIPWPAAVPWLGYLLGILWSGCGIAMFFQRSRRAGAVAFAVLFVLCALVFDVSRYAAHVGSVSLRTRLLEPLAIASLAWIAADLRGGRIVLGLCLVLFGIDHYLVLAPVASLIPDWIPWHVFWTAFFGAAFVAAGIAIALGVLERWAMAGMALMYAVWVVTLHVPRTLGAYGVPGAIRDPNEWSSLFIATALCGGFWLLAHGRQAVTQTEAV